MTKPRRITSRTRSIITRSGRSVRNTSDGEGLSDATEGSRSYEVEDRHQARRGSRASFVESEGTGDSANVYDSAAESVLGSLQQFRLDGAADVARGSRPAAMPPASVGHGSVRRWCTNSALGSYLDGQSVGSGRSSTA